MPINCKTKAQTAVKNQNKKATDIKSLDLTRLSRLYDKHKSIVRTNKTITASNVRTELRFINKDLIKNRLINVINQNNLIITHANHI